MKSHKYSFRLIFFLSFGLMLLTMSAGCSGSSKNEAPRPASQTSVKSTAQAPSTVLPAPSGLVPEIRKVIETAQVTLETKDLPTTEKLAFDLLTKRKGIIGSSSVTLDGNGRRNGTYMLRVPSGQLQNYVNDLAELQDVVVRQRSLSTQDVTEEFVDISARLGNMQLHENRLREILTKANTVDEIIKVEKELASVRTQIESTTGRIKAMTGKIEMSTVQLRISEVTVISETNFFGKLKSIIRDSWVAAGDVVLYLIATVIVLSPLAILVITIWWWWKRRCKSKQVQPPKL
jgi:hypothetical protein